MSLPGSAERARLHICNANTAAIDEMNAISLYRHVIWLCDKMCETIVVAVQVGVVGWRAEENKSNFYKRIHNSSSYVSSFSFFSHS